ncbi:MAG: hypothetical protein M3352_10300 [Bacteroidota bacterium]|nr:hypothetical protein [Bacteroidota bacterium]
MNDAKIQFSPSEMELMSNAEIILTKNKILQKIKTLLEQLQDKMIQYGEANINDQKSNSLLASHPKISRGENYAGLPYLILDYPRLFYVSNIFTIRSMFWWGNFFSTTLHLAGSYKEKNLSHIENAYHDLAKHQFYIGVNEDQWMHHFEEGNYLLIKNLSKEEFIQCCMQYGHVKLATHFSLEEIHSAINNLFENWKLLIEILPAKHQCGGTDLLTDDPKDGFDP